MKKTMLFLILAITLLLFCACGTGSSAPAAAPEAEPPAAEPSSAPSAPPVETGGVPEREEIPAADAPGFVFETTDREGNPVDQSVFAGAKLTILNFWEPWCPPCVAEMPDLQKLYEDLSPEGLQIIGVYSTSGQEDDVDSVLESAGTTYPILHYTDAFDVFQTGYVPTTVFIDSEGNLVGETQIGSHSYTEWEALVRRLLP